MNQPIEIRKLYNPIQPTVNSLVDKVAYTEFLPHRNLQDFIYCYWQLKTTQTLSDPFHYRVVTDGCIDIIFELGNPQESAVMGFCKTYKKFPLNKAFNYVGVRFLPTMFPQLFKINAIELSNRVEDLYSVAPHFSRFIANRFNANHSKDEIKGLFDNYFLNLLGGITFDNDRRLYGALGIMLKNSGAIAVEKELNTGFSPRQLRRIFEFYIGGTPKSFSKVVRFQNILKAMPSKKSMRQNSYFFDAGYYDQSHFIKDFKTFYGRTPSKAFDK